MELDYELGPSRVHLPRTGQAAGPFFGDSAISRVDAGPTARSVGPEEGGRWAAVGWGIGGAYWVPATVGFGWVSSAGIQVPNEIIFLAFFGSALPSSIAVGVAFFRLAQHLLARRPPSLWFPAGVAVYLFMGITVFSVLGLVRVGRLVVLGGFLGAFSPIGLLVLLAWPIMSGSLAFFVPD